MTYVQLAVCDIQIYIFVNKHSFRYINLLHIYLSSVLDYETACQLLNLNAF